MSFTTVILAAGVGSRLRPLTDDIPKCLAPLVGETILARTVRMVIAAGTRHVVVSTGYQDQAVRAALAGVGVPVTCVYNPDYAVTQNIVSLHRALAVVDDDPVVKFDGDVVFSSEVLTRLLKADLCEEEGAVAVDDRTAPPEEAMKVEASKGRVMRFGKGLKTADCAGESIGIERFAQNAVGRLAAALGTLVAAGRTDVYYEDAYNALIAERVVLRCVSVGDLAWTEVDDAADLQRARELVGQGM